MGRLGLGLDLGAGEEPSLAAVPAHIFLCQGSQELLQRSQLSGLMEPGL